MLEKFAFLDSMQTSWLPDSGFVAVEPSCGSVSCEEPLAMQRAALRAHGDAAHGWDLPSPWKSHFLN